MSRLPQNGWIVLWNNYSSQSVCYLHNGQITKCHMITEDLLDFLRKTAPGTFGTISLNDTDGNTLKCDYKSGQLINCSVMVADMNHLEDSLAGMKIRND